MINYVFNAIVVTKEESSQDSSSLLRLLLFCSLFICVLLSCFHFMKGLKMIFNNFKPILTLVSNEFCIYVYRTFIYICIR
jgi:hypothetical protein